MIVIEGGDNTGKTTLIKQLMDADPRLHLLKRPRFKPERKESIGTSYLECLLPENVDRVHQSWGIADRLLASECIYGRLFRDGCRMNEAEHRAINHVLASFDAVVVWCDPPNDAIVRAWKDREQLYDDPIKIAEAYRASMTDSFKVPFVRYDWTSNWATRDRERILAMNHLANAARRRHLSWWNMVPFGVGELNRPNVILIGESPSPLAKTPVPFSNGSAGNFLAWAMDELGMSPRRVYVTNARKGTAMDEAILREELSFLVKPRCTHVITLGKVAEAMMEKIAGSLVSEPASIASIPHPIFWRRFHWKKKEEYVDMLAEAIA